MCDLLQRNSLEGGPEAESSSSAIVQVVAASSSSSAATTDGSGNDVQVKKKRRSSSGCDPDAKQEELPVHVIKRTMLLKTKCTDPAQCVDMIDRMYNVYYELEVRWSFHTEFHYV